MSSIGNTVQNIDTSFIDSETTGEISQGLDSQKVVLVGEDTPSTLYVISNCLKFDNHVVATASDGEEIVNKALEIKPDIIVLDIMLPGCNGLNLVKSIKKPLPNTKICIMSVIDDRKTIQKAINLGVEDYIVKPICPELLTHKINLLSGRNEEEIQELTKCDLKLVMRNDSSILSGSISLTSQYMLKARFATNPNLDQIYRCRSNSLNKIMERDGDFFARVCKIEEDSVFLEMIGIANMERRKLKMFTANEQNFTDSSFFN